MIKLPEYSKTNNLRPRTADMESIDQTKFADPIIEYMKDCRWVGYEKLDGMNIRVVILPSGIISVLGRTDRATLPITLVESIYAHFAQLDIQKIIEELNIKDEPMILFGEGLGVKIQSNQYGLNVDEFVGFDIHYRGQYYGQAYSRQILDSVFKLRAPKVLAIGTITELEDVVREHRAISALNPDTYAEGLICHPDCDQLTNLHNRRIKCKIKLRDYKNKYAGSSFDEFLKEGGCYD